MYFTDSPEGCIKAYPYDANSGEISVSEGRIFWKAESGVPDGHC